MAHKGEFDNSDKQTILDLHTQGLNMRQIGLKLNRSYAYVKRVLQGEGIEANKTVVKYWKEKYNLKINEKGQYAKTSNRN